MKNVICLLVFLVGLSVFGQVKKVDIKVGELAKGKKSSVVNGLIGNTDESIYILKESKAPKRYLL